jgi:hypothetical protein
MVSLQAGTRRDNVNPPGVISLKPSAWWQYVPLALVILNQSTAVGYHVHDPLAVTLNMGTGGENVDPSIIVLLQVRACRENVDPPCVISLKPSTWWQYMPLVLVILNQPTPIGHHVHDPLGVTLQMGASGEVVGSPGVVPLQLSVRIRPVAEDEGVNASIGVDENRPAENGHPAVRVVELVADKYGQLVTWQHDGLARHLKDRPVGLEDGLWDEALPRVGGARGKAYC